MRKIKFVLEHQGISQENLRRAAFQGNLRRLPEKYGTFSGNGTKLPRNARKLTRLCSQIQKFWRKSGDCRKGQEISQSLGSSFRQTQGQEMCGQYINVCVFNCWPDQTTSNFSLYKTSKRLEETENFLAAFQSTSVIESLLMIGRQDMLNFVLRWW